MDGMAEEEAKQRIGAELYNAIRRVGELMKQQGQSHQRIMGFGYGMTLLVDILRDNEEDQAPGLPNTDTRWN